MSRGAKLKFSFFFSLNSPLPRESTVNTMTWLWRCMPRRLYLGPMFRLKQNVATQKLSFKWGRDSFSSVLPFSARIIIRLTPTSVWRCLWHVRNRSNVFSTYKSQSHLCSNYASVKLSWSGYRCIFFLTHLDAEIHFSVQIVLAESCCCRKPRELNSAVIRANLTTAWRKQTSFFSFLQRRGYRCYHLAS